MIVYCKRILVQYATTLINLLYRRRCALYQQNKKNKLPRLLFWRPLAKLYLISISYPYPPASYFNCRTIIWRYTFRSRNTGTSNLFSKMYSKMIDTQREYENKEKEMERVRESYKVKTCACDRNQWVWDWPMVRKEKIDGKKKNREKRPERKKELGNKESEDKMHLEREVNVAKTHREKRWNCKEWARKGEGDVERERKKKWKSW